MLGEPNVITRLELERWSLGRLGPERAAALERLGRQDPGLQARMQRVRIEIERARRDLPPLVLPARAEEASLGLWQRLLSWRPPPRPQAVLGLCAAATALALLLVLPERFSGPAGDEGPRKEVFRGALDLQLHRVRLGSALSQGSQVQARQDDRLQYVVTAPAAGWLQIVNLQDDGQLQQYLASRPVAAHEAVPSAVLLDDYTGSERIFFLFSHEPIPDERIREAAASAGPLAELDQLPGLGPDVTQRSVLVIKEDPP